jgi:hypothetical protein
MDSISRRIEDDVRAEMFASLHGVTGVTNAIRVDEAR